MKLEGLIEMLIVKYDRKDFFGNPIYTEDKKQNHNRDDLKKAFLFFGKSHEIAIQIDDMVIYWDSLTEYENRIATVRDYDGMNYTESKQSYNTAKKKCYAGIQ